MFPDWEHLLTPRAAGNRPDDRNLGETPQVLCIHDSTVELRRLEKQMVNQ
jgi:hypothetical protein